MTEATSFKLTYRTMFNPSEELHTRFVTHDLAKRRVALYHKDPLRTITLPSLEEPWQCNQQNSTCQCALPLPHPV